MIGLSAGEAGHEADVPISPLTDARSLVARLDIGTSDAALL
jgi:hypothetical protein